MDGSKQASQTETGVRVSSSGKLYVFSVFACGIAAIVHSVYELQIQPVSHQWLILAALTLVSGSATVRVASIPATVSVSETFVFTAVLLFGTAAGTLTVALDPVEQAGGITATVGALAGQARAARIGPGQDRATACAPRAGLGPAWGSKSGIHCFFPVSFIFPRFIFFPGEKKWIHIY